MKLVVTGAGGGLGRAFLDRVPGHHDLVPLKREDLDVGDHHAVMQTIVPIAPDAVLNFAGMTAVDACESDREGAYRANTIGPHNVALAARRCDAVFLHVSTDYVFDGTKGEAYDELDSPNPVSAYGRSKLGGEIAVRRTLPEHYVVRTGYVFGAGDDYPSRAIRRLAEGDTAGGVTDRVGSPTYVRHLAERILPLLLTGRFGTYHLAGTEPATWFDVLARAKSLGGLPGELTEQTEAELNRPAPRPENSSMISLFTKELGIEPMPPLDVALKELLDGDH